MKNIGRGSDWFRRKWLEYQVTERIWGFSIMELLVIVVILLLVAI